jgi:hypothetical protein
MALTKAFPRIMEGVVLSAKDFGAIGDGSTDDTLAIQAAIDATPQNGSLDLAGLTYAISSAIVMNKRMVLQNGVLKQTTEAENVLEVPGPLSYGPTLRNVGLTHDFTTASAGSLLDIGDGGNVGFLTWDGSLSFCTGGYYGVRSHGGTYMMRFNRVWITNIYSSGFYLPASGDVVNDSALGGSTTTTLTTCFVSNIQTVDPAFAIGTGYDTVRLENCSADSVTNFGFFKAQPLQIVNCSSENIRNPIVGSLTGTHRFITLSSGAGQEVNGFHSTFDAGFTAPTPSGGTVNALIYSANANNLNVAGIRGSVPSGYYMLDQEGGQAFVNSQSLGNGVRNTSSSNFSAPNRSVAQAENTHTFNRLTTSAGISTGNICELQANSSTVGSVAVGSSDSLVFQNEVNSASVVLSAKNSGGIADSVFYNANVPAFFPISDNTNSLGRAGFKWSVVYAGTGTINTSDANEKTDIRDLSEKEKAVALRIKEQIKSFKFKDAVEKKGINARIHFGVIAQDVKEAFEAEGLDANKYGLFCSDTWWSDAEGNVHDEQEDGLTKVTRLGIRYDELLAFVISGM